MNTSKNHDNIDEIYKKIWDCLKLGIKESKSDYHTFSLATSDEKLSYNRTVVLRDYDIEKHTIIFHTNNLSNKVKQIRTNTNVSALFYSKDDKIQIRFTGHASINNQDEYCDERWNKMHPQSKKCYYQNIKPGTYIDHPELVKTEKTDLLSKDFSIITININSIDWLFLSSSGHIRAEYLRINKFAGKWIAP